MDANNSLEKKLCCSLDDLIAQQQAAKKAAAAAGVQKVCSVVPRDANPASLHASLLQSSL